LPLLYPYSNQMLANGRGVVLLLQASLPVTTHLYTENKPAEKT